MTNVRGLHVASTQELPGCVHIVYWIKLRESESLRELIFDVGKTRRNSKCNSVYADV